MVSVRKQVSLTLRILLVILADLTDAVVWMVTIRPLISNSFTSILSFGDRYKRASYNMHQCRRHISQYSYFSSNV